MRLAILTSALLGVLWNVLAVRLMGGMLGDSMSPTFLLAGAVAGALTGMFAIWLRRRHDGRESVLQGVATYFVGMLAYWLVLVVVMRIELCVRFGGWTSFDLRDHMSLILIFVVYGTLWFGVVLIPLCFLSRYLIWKIYARNAA